MEQASWAPAGSASRVARCAWSVAGQVPDARLKAVALRLGSTVRHSDPARSSSTNTYASRFFGSLILVGMVSALTYGISRLGYLASDAALLLMGLRPAGRAYEYLVERLSSIGREVRFPRDDVFALRSRIDDLETQVKA